MKRLPKDEKKVAIAIRIPPDVKEHFEALADEEERSLSNMISVTLEAIRLQDSKQWRDELLSIVKAHGKRKKTKR